MLMWCVWQKVRQNDRQVFAKRSMCESEYSQSVPLEIVILVYTHSPVARTFFWCTYTARALRTFLCVLHTCIAQGMAQGCLQCACRHLSVISLSPFSCFTRPCSCCSLTVTSRPLPTTSSTTSLTILSTRSSRTSPT